MGHVQADQIVRYGDKVRLRCQDGRFLSACESWGFYWYPTLDNQPMALQLMGGAPTIPVNNYGVVKLKTTEEKVGTSNLLGAWSTPALYYYDPFDEGKQSWELQKVGTGGELHYGDRVRIVNKSHSGQGLTAHGDRWLTTRPDGDVWEIMPA